MTHPPYRIYDKIRMVQDFTHILFLYREGSQKIFFFGYKFTYSYEDYQETAVVAVLFIYFCFHVYYDLGKGKKM